MASVFTVKKEFFFVSVYDIFSEVGIVNCGVTQGTTY